MADTQIRGLGSGSAPLSYTVPGSQEIILKSLFAAFDGSAAAAAFLPCVRLIAPGGGVVAEYITDASVAAGSSAEVSFAPFLRGATAAAGGSLGIEHNGAAIGTEANLDFEDGGVTWTITDVPASSRVEVTGSATGGTNFGFMSWDVPLIAYTSAAGPLHSTGVAWVFDAAVSSGGYVTKAAPADGSYFVVLVPMQPRNAIYGFTFTYSVGPDYGKFDVNIASLTYQDAARGVGSVAGKIQDVFVSGGGTVDAGYGANPVFKNIIQYDGYSAGAIAEGGSAGTLTFIPGGAEGAVLTNLSATTDAYTGLGIADGGPGWYALQFKVNGKNAASTNFRFRIISLQVLRVPDGQGF